MENSAKSQLVEKLQSSTNILVTVSRDPSVDQLAACVGLTLLLNKFGKHATAVFSGEVPSTLEFLQPEHTLEKTTDSLRDFIIALDKSKADKLRYKVEDEMVRIFITPFRVSLTSDDLVFSQGDFNVDVVIALGVSRQEDFDAAIMAHGRILHDAVVSSISTTSGADLGSINWSEPGASSLSEVIVALAHALGDDLIDQQVATALLTGIVSETARFSNEKTTPQTMSLSAELMAAGANQQLVATQLAVPAEAPPAAIIAETTEPDVEPEVAEPVKTTTVDGTLEIDHDHIDAVLEDLEADDEVLPTEPIAHESAEAQGSEVESAPSSNKQSRLIVDPPTLGGTLTANAQVESLDPANDALGLSSAPQPALLSRSSNTPLEQPSVLQTQATPTKHEPVVPDFTPPPAAWVPATQAAGNEPTSSVVPASEVSAAPEAAAPVATPDDTKTLSEIEDAVHANASQHLDSVRDEVARAINGQPEPPQPVIALNAQPLGEPLRAEVDTLNVAAAQTAPAFSDLLNQVIPPAPGVVALPVPPAEPAVVDPHAPPPVPPPIPFNFGAPQQ